MHNTSLFDFRRRYLQHLLKSDLDYKQPLYLFWEVFFTFYGQTCVEIIHNMLKQDMSYLFKWLFVLILILSMDNINYKTFYVETLL